MRYRPTSIRITPNCKALSKTGEREKGLPILKAASKAAKAYFVNQCSLLGHVINLELRHCLSEKDKTRPPFVGW